LALRPRCRRRGGREVAKVRALSLVVALVLPLLLVAPTASARCQPAELASELSCPCCADARKACPCSPRAEQANPQCRCGSPQPGDLPSPADRYLSPHPWVPAAGPYSADLIPTGREPPAYCRPGRVAFHPFRPPPRAPPRGGRRFSLAPRGSPTTRPWRSLNGRQRRKETARCRSRGSCSGCW